MLTEFATIQFNREELLELHRSLLLAAMVEDELRHERGLEKVGQHPLLDKIEALLGIKEDKLHALDHQVEDEMWEFAWYAFTDEWAWTRAAQDVEKELSESSTKPSDADRKTLVETRYRERFDAYVAEVDMRESKKEKFSPAKQNKKPSA
ncbi:hypothetical protein HZC53_03030 [Candidatus Uhrbacteria bacterium]|nr:hypothetical protein [Candidatus Uhrbacteria bacterium]